MIMNMMGATEAGNYICALRAVYVYFYWMIINLIATPIHF
jgi:hypothetical protein